MYSIWGKKSKEAEAEKKKPRTSAAQIRVQKGWDSFFISTGVAFNNPISMII
jgi:hypothetical protein